MFVWSEQKPKALKGSAKQREAAKRVYVSKILEMDCDDRALVDSFTMCDYAKFWVSTESWTVGEIVAGIKRYRELEGLIDACTLSHELEMGAKYRSEFFSLVGSMGW